MAKCPECGKSVGLFEKICDECKERIIAERKELIEAKKEQEINEEKEKQKQLVISILGEIKRRLQNNQSLFLYESIYLPVDSILLDQPTSRNFDISICRKMGLDGWKIIQVIPKTIGIGLENSAVGYSGGKSWGGGSGGNIVGVYLILEKELKNVEEMENWGKILIYISNHIHEFQNN